MMIHARQVLPLLLFTCISGATAGDSVYVEEAGRLAGLPYAPGYTPPTDFARSLNYDAVRRIRIKRQHWLFNHSSGSLQVEPRLAASFNSRGIQLGFLNDGLPNSIPFRAGLFDFPEDIANPGDGKLSGFGGFRVHGTARPGGPSYEQFSFGGASYFRGHAESLTYGLSARGLILRRDGKEEFPIFERFAFEEPSPQSSVMIWHALLNSPSVTGAFHFVSTPGNPHAMEVHADIFLRAGLSWKDVGIGLGGFSSMYWFSPASVRRPADFRERVHDTEALAITTASGERIWRVLSNPGRVRDSSFAVHGLRGFGLIQRERSFSAYEDETARYERRTSAWVVPLSGMDAGHVKLLEIPTRGEYDDNIVAYYAPDTLPAPAGPLHVAYRLLWCDDVPSAGPGPGLARILQTRIGLLPDKSGITLLTVDFEDRGIDKASVPDIQLPPGLEKRFAYLKPLPDGKTLRLHLGVIPLAALEGASVEIRATLVDKGKPISETWVYPWNGISGTPFQQKSS